MSQSAAPPFLIDEDQRERDLRLWVKAQGVLCQSSRLKKVASGVLRGLDFREKRGCGPAHLNPIQALRYGWWLVVPLHAKLDRHQSQARRNSRFICSIDDFLPDAQGSLMARPVNDLRGFRRWGKAGIVGEEEPMRFLEQQGYVLTKEWGWRKPSASHKVTAEEADAIQYLKEMWDFAGLEP